MVRSSLVNRRLNTISIFNPFADDAKDFFFRLLITILYSIGTWIIVIKAPCLDVVLGQLGVSQQLHGVGHQLHIALGKLLQLQVHSANLKWGHYYTASLVKRSSVLDSY